MDDSKKSFEGPVCPEPRQKPPVFLTVKQFSDYFPWPTESGLRFYIFHSKSNGLDKALIRIGRRIIIDTEEFIAWVRSNGKEVK